MCLLNNTILTYQTYHILWLNNNGEEDTTAQKMIAQMYITNRPVSINESEWEDQFENIIDLMKRQLYNLTFAKLYTYGKRLYHDEDTERKLTKHQRNALFIYEYFKDIPEAINFIKDVTLDTINRLTIKDRETLIEHRQAIVHRSDKIDQGPANPEVDDLWGVLDDNDEALFLTSPPPAKRPRIRTPTPHPSAFPVTQELFDWVDPFSPASPEFEPLEDYLGVGDNTRKRKFE